MAVSSIGIGSGLDVNGIVSQMVALEKRPLVQLQTQAASIQTRLSTYSQIKSLMSTLGDAAAKLTRDGSWNSMAISSSNAEAVSATVTGIASASSFGISVQQLARAQSVASTAVPKDAPVGGGVLAIQLGAWSTVGGVTEFTPAVDAAVKPVTINAGDSLTTIATKINDSGAGVTATVMRDASGERLLIRSAKTGEEQGFRIQVTEDPGSPGLSALSFDPKDAAGVGMAANAVQYGQNAKAKLNGIDISSSTNTFAETVPGLSITVSKVTADDVNLQVAQDTAAMKKNIQDFVDAYNAVNDLLGSSTKYDSETKVAGVLQGDSTAVGLQGALRMLTMGAAGSDGAFQRLSDVGISMQRGGKLTVDTSKLDKALKDPVSLKALFATPATAGQGGGIGVQFKNFTSGLLSFDGLMNNKTDALSASAKRNTSEQDKVNERAAIVEKRLRAQYSALDTKMASLTSLSGYISQQVSSWNRSNN